MRKEQKKLRMFSFIVFLAVTAAFAFVYYVVAANLAGNTASLEWMGFGGDTAANLTTLLTGIFGLIAAPVLGVVAIFFGIRSANSRVKLLRILSIVLCALIVAATIVLVVLFFTVK